MLMHFVLCTCIFTKYVLWCSTYRMTEHAACLAYLLQIHATFDSSVASCANNAFIRDHSMQQCPNARCRIIESCNRRFNFCLPKAGNQLKTRFISPEAKRSRTVSPLFVNSKICVAICPVNLTHKCAFIYAFVISTKNRYNQV